MRVCLLVLALVALAAAGDAGAASRPATFSWPTSVAAEPNGSLLVVENGLQRLMRIDRAGRTTEIGSGLIKPYAVVRSSAGAILVTDGSDLKRVDATGTRLVATLPAEIGPITVATNGDVYLATAARIYRLPHGAAKPELLPATGVSGPHGITVARDGAVLVSDTGHNRIVRVDPKTGALTTLTKASSPRGLAVAADGTIYVVEAGRKRVAHLSSLGKRLGFVGPRFGDPYALALAKGTIYVVDTSATGTIGRIAVSTG